MAQNRLLSLDILRGLTVAGMIMVNNPGSWGDIYEPLRHAEWNGLTPTDLVFPFFMFIMGVSTYFSLRKYDFKFSWPSAAKVIRRTLVIFFIGWAIAWFSTMLRGLRDPDMSAWQAMTNFGTIRALGVMPRLALCYGATALLAMALKRRALVWTVVVILVGYAVTLILGHGYEFSDQNVISIVDHKVLGENHMYTDHIDGVSLKFDPEGLLSTLPSIAHCIIGFLCGGLIMSTKDNRERVNKLFIVGTILTFAGLLLSYGFPINKKIWSPTFVLTTCGLASSLLALLIWIIDMRGHKRWCRFFEAFGVNPLFMYCLGTVLAILLAHFRVDVDGEPLPVKIAIFRQWIVPLCGECMKLASLVYALLFVCVNWCVGYVLYKKKIYIKI